MRRMSAVDPRVSFAELETFEDYGGLLRYELYEGEVIALAAALPRHQLVVAELASLLRDYQRTHGGLLFAPSGDIVLSTHDVFIPDAVWIRRERIQLIETIDEPISFVPDLAIEVISRSTGARDRGRKKQIVGKYGLPEYWLVEPVAKTLEVYTQNEGRLDLVGYYAGQEEVTSPTLTDLRFTVDTIFVDPRSH